MKVLRTVLHLLESICSNNQMPQQQQNREWGGGNLCCTILFHGYRNHINFSNRASLGFPMSAELNQQNLQILINCAEAKQRVVKSNVTLQERFFI